MGFSSRSPCARRSAVPARRRPDRAAPPAARRSRTARQRRRQPFGRHGDQNAVIRTASGPADAAVGVFQMHVAQPQRREPLTRAQRQALDAFDAVDLPDQRAKARHSDNPNRCRSPAPAAAARRARRAVPASCATMYGCGWSGRGRSAARCPHRRGWPAPPSMNRWRGVSRITASTRSSSMPCSRSRATSRVRVRAEVMPMPRKASSGGSRLRPRASGHGRDQAGASSQRATVSSAAWRVRSTWIGVTDTQCSRIAWKSVPGPASLSAPADRSTRSAGRAIAGETAGSALCR